MGTGEEQPQATLSGTSFKTKNELTVHSSAYSDSSQTKALTSQNTSFEMEGVFFSPGGTMLEAPVEDELGGQH